MTEPKESDDARPSALDAATRRRDRSAHGADNGTAARVAVTTTAAQRAGRWLRLTATLELTGFGLCSLLGYGPWLELFWRQAWAEPIVHGWFNRSWRDFVQDAQTAAMLGHVGAGLGVVYLVAAAMALALRPRRIALAFLCLATLLIVTQALLSYATAGARVFQFLEYSLQIICPLAAFVVVRGSFAGRGVQRCIAVAIALTFAAHGVWALSIDVHWGGVNLFYPTPGEWVDMTLRLWPASDEAQARWILRVAGAADLCVAVAVLLPGVRRLALAWATVWGGLTALARIAAHADSSGWSIDLVYWLAETLRRAPHAGVPLALWVMQSRAFRSSSAS